MNFKFLILLIAVCYVHSTPVSDKIIVDKVPNEVQSSPIQAISLPSFVPSVIESGPVGSESETDKKLVRTARDNKVEYIYVNADGELLPNQKVYAAKNLIPHPEELASTHHEKVSSSLKESLASRSSDTVSVDSKDHSSDKAADALHYASNGLKIRSENVRSRLSNGKSKRPFAINIRTKNVLALPSTINSGQNSPLISTLYPSQISQSVYPNDALNLNNPLISSSLYTPSINYPITTYPSIMQGIYPYNSMNLGASFSTSPSNIVNRAITTNNLAPIPEEIETRRVVLPQIGTQSLDYMPFQTRMISPVSTSNYLYGRSLNGLIISPYYQSSPFSNYLLPQQAPNLMSRTSSNNLNTVDYGLNGLNIMSPSLLQPQSYSLAYPSVYPQYQSIAYQPLMVPQIVTPQIIPQSNQATILTQPQMTTADYTPPRRTVITTTETTTTNNVQPFSDSVTTTANTGPTVVLSGITEPDQNGVEKPLFYSNQNAALRLSSMPYESSLYSGIYPNAMYPNRLIDPIGGLSSTSLLSRYPTSSYNSRYSYPYSSSYYPRPLIAPYPNIYQAGPVFGPYNGIGYVSPMHYSADTSSILNQNKKTEETSKPSVIAKEQVTDKATNLMYTIKTSKSESKETVSRLNDANKIREEDKKAA